MRQSSGRPPDARPSKMLHVWAPMELIEKIQKDAEQSGWSISQQVRFELAYPRGLAKMPKPCLPQSHSPKASRG